MAINNHLEAINIAKELAKGAEKWSESNKCVEGEAVFFYEYPIPLIPGHIYSWEGRDEFRISRCCEYHFDKFFAEKDDPCREVIDAQQV